MKLPYLKEVNLTRQVMNAFGGYHKSLKIGDGELYDMANLTSDHYPVLATRDSAQTVYHGGNPVDMPDAVIAKDKLCYARGGKFYIDHAEVPDFALNDKPKQLVSMGAYVVIFPDKKYINTKDTNDKGELEARTELTETGSTYDSKTIDIRVCTPNVSGGWDNVGAGDTGPKPSGVEHADGDRWFDTSSNPPVLKIYSSELGMWKTVTTAKVKIAAVGIGVKFKKGDWVTIETDTITEVRRLNGNWELTDVTDDYIVVNTILSTNTANVPTNKTLTVHRKVPDLDYVTEGSNRLWGCKYGVVEGKTVNEIYACALGDFKNWNKFGGIATDSYAASIGTDGPFTGAVTYNGYPIFFKEDRMHRVYGSYPANYQITDVKCNGVREGAAKSLAIVNNVLYYVSRTGVMAYDGTVPTVISGNLGDSFVCQKAVGGGLHKKYYASLTDGDTDTLFVFDADKGLWHRVGTDFHISAFCGYDNALLFTETGGEYLRAIKGSGEDYRADETDMEWYAESGIYNTDDPDRKYIVMLTIRMALTPGSDFMIDIQYDSDGHWKRVCKLRGKNLRSFNVPVRPRRCDHFRLRLSGKGEAKVFSVTSTVEGGSEIQNE